MCHDQLVFADFSNSNNIDFEDYFAPELARLGPLADDGADTLGDSRFWFVGGERPAASHYRRRPAGAPRRPQAVARIPPASEARLVCCLVV